MRESVVVRALLFLVVATTACRVGFDPSKTDPTGDAPAPLADAPFIDGNGACEQVACAASGGSCTANVCVIAATAETAVMCPTGMACRIECTGSGRPCRDGASCGAATDCELRCIGYRACQAGASCGTAPICTVTCDGEEACQDGISTSAGTSCTSHCCGLGACLLGVGSCSQDATCS